ncbi:hypothetical protein Brsp06_02681 [Brucella sp. NBRC 13694]|jgi:hypothetical protein
MLARDELEKVVGWRNLHGVVLRAHEPMTRLLFAYLQGLHDVASKLSASEVYSAQEAMLSLLNASIKGDAIESAAVNLTMRKCILAHINENLNNPSLSPNPSCETFAFLAHTSIAPLNPMEASPRSFAISGSTAHTKRW